MSGLRGACPVCRHTQVERINRALLSGQSIRNLSRRNALARSSLARHQARCLPLLEEQEEQSAAERHRDGALGRLEERMAEARRILKEARLTKNFPVWRQTNMDLAELEKEFEALSRALLPRVAEDMDVQVSFTTDNKVHAKLVPATDADDADPSAPIETTAATTSRPALPPAPESPPKPDPPKAAAARVGGPAKQPPPPERRLGWSRRDEEFLADPTERDAAEDEANSDDRGKGRFKGYS